MLDTPRILKTESNFTIVEKGQNSPEVENGSLFTKKNAQQKVKQFQENII